MCLYVQMVNNNICCVANCKNNGRNSNCRFYKFPRESYRLEQRRKWIAAVRKINTTDWNPKPSDNICSAHFIGGARANEEISPAYVPSLFQNHCKLKVATQQVAIMRHARFMRRKFNIFKQELLASKNDKQIKETPMDILESSMECGSDAPVDQDYAQFCDKGCQADTFQKNSELQRTFTCNRYIYPSGCCDAEVQTDITANVKIIVPNRRQFKDKQCGTPVKNFADKSVGVNVTSANSEPLYFSGILSVKSNEQLIDLAGVTLKTFKYLLQGVKSAGENAKISKENRLFIFLMKMKTGLTFSAMSVLFSVHRTSVSRIFFSVLEELACATANLVFWPDKDLIRGTMPECFVPEYQDTRVIIDCTEFRIEVPSSVDNRVYTYSHYKKGFTGKLLVGITPGGFISFKSKVAGGRKSDSQITIESGLLDLLEDGDVVLADKGFPDIRQVINDKGKKVVVVMPPFLEKKSEFTKEETEQTYNIARVRIHVERIMQRLRTYQILNKIPENLFQYIDDIVHVCCVLVNLQPPIIADEKEISIGNRELK